MIPCLQGFKYTNFTASDAVKVLLNIERRLGRKFSRDEIESGVLKDLLIEEDYKIEKVVSSHLISALLSLFYTNFLFPAQKHVLLG